MSFCSVLVCGIYHKTNTDQEGTVSVVPNGTNTTMLITRISCVGYTNFPKTKLINYSIVIMQGVTIAIAIPSHMRFII